MLKGIDISKWQAGIDLTKIDTDFVICKATEGVGYTDPYCDLYYQEARRLNKKVGIYHFARPDLGNTAEAEADYFVKETLGYQKEAILILDWESGNLGNITWAQAWLDQVYQKTGVKPLIYMSASVMRNYDWSSVVKDNYGLWVANYGVNNGLANDGVFNTYPLKYWSFYALWQYTSVGRLSGYNENLDLNYFNGDRTAWDKYAGVDIDGQEGKTINELVEDVIAGKYGNGDERKKALGNQYEEVQLAVNQKLGITDSKAITYTVQKGDTLSGIANKYNTTYQRIAQDNNIANPDLIYPGQKLVINQNLD